jgi:hypothetical protein
MFPFTFSRTIEIPVADETTESASKAISSLLSRRIKAEMPRSFTSNPHQISFSGGVFRFVGSWNLLVSITYGVIDFMPTNDKLLVSYKLWFMELFVLASLMTIFFGFLIFSSGLTIQNFSLVVALWFWFFVPAYIMAVARFHNVIKWAQKWALRK